VQGDIAGRVVQSLGVALNAGARQTLAERPTGNLAAYDAYLKGDEAASGFGSDVVALQRAVTLYERAIALDSNFAPAWAKLAAAQSTLYFSGTTSLERAESARRSAERARSLAPDRPESYWAQGLYYENVLADNRRALSEFTAGLQKAPSNVPLLTASALAEQTLGRWDASLGHLRQAQTLDPRDVLTARRLAVTYLWLRRYPEATATTDRALALAPDNLTVIETKAMVSLAQGDLPGAQAALRAAPPSVDRTALAAFLGNFWDLYWVLDTDMRQRLLAASSAPFGGDPVPWTTVLTETNALQGDKAKTRRFADSARRDYEAVLRATPQDAQMTGEYGLMLAYLGRKDDAIRSAERAVALGPIAQDGYSGPYYQHLLVRTYLLTGEPEKALDALEPLLKVPYYLSPGWLKIDPTFAPLRGNPRFEKLVAGN
jgi:tetratricopeptide (TPR) repeat protein